MAKACARFAHYKHIEDEMSTRNILTLALLGLVTAAPAITAPAQDMPTDPLGGKPPAGSKVSVDNLHDQVTYQRAFEAVVWSMPAVAKYGLHRGTFEMGAGNNVVLAWSEGAKPLFEALTPNNTTPYVNGTTDLRKGPVVLEVPKANAKASLFGQVADNWYITIADIGPIGVDKGKGGKILLTPPGYADKVPADFIEVKSPMLHPRLCIPFDPVARWHAAGCLRTRSATQSLLPV